MYCLSLRRPTVPFVVTRPIRVSRGRVIKVAASLSEILITQSALIGKGLTLFVLFTTSLNYLYYRELRKRIEERENLNQKKSGEKRKDDGKL